MHLFRPHWTSKDPKTGAVRKGRSRTWHVQFYERGVKRVRSLKTTDRKVADQLAARLLREAEYVGAGLRDAYREAQRIPLGEWVVAYGKSLEAREVTEQHRLDRVGALEEFANDTGAKGLSDLTLDRAQAWLAEVRKRPTRRGEPRSARDVNRRRSALREFTLWLVKGGRLLGDPLAALAPLNEAADRRHVRRALKPAEVAALLAAARRRPVEELAARARAEAEGRARTGRARRRPSEVSEVSRARAAALGRLRALVYALATGTGLRRGELGRLRWQDVVLDDKRGHVLVTAASAKSREAQSVPLRSDVLALLRAEREGRKGEQESAPVVPPRSFPSLRCLAADLEAAGIKRAGEDGRVVDFHALRTTFVSSLAAAGIHPRIAQSLARHSSVELTMKAYTDLSLLDVRGAIEATAPLGAPALVAALVQPAPEGAAPCRSVPVAPSEPHLAESRKERRRKAAGDRS